MARKFTTEQLIENALQRAFVSGAQSEGTADDDIRGWLNDGIISLIAPRLAALREEFLVVEEHQALVDGQLVYPMPERAMGKNLHSVKWVNTTPSPSERTSLVKVQASQNDEWEGEGDSKYPRYFVQGNDIVIAGVSPRLEGLLEIAYYFEPNELVFSGDGTNTTGYAIVSAVDFGFSATETEVTLDRVYPTGWVIATTGDKFDFQTSKSGGSVKCFSVSQSSTAGTDTLYFLTEDVDGSQFGRKAIEVGDYVAREKECAIPMGIPRNMHPLVAQAAAIEILASGGDTEQWQIARRCFQDMWESLRGFQDQRVKGDAKQFTGGGMWGRRRRGSWGFRRA